MNVRQCCEKLNRMFLPEVFLHLLLTILFVFNGNWFVFLLNVPMDMWSVYKYFKRQKSPGQLGYYDPLEINNNRKIKSHMQELLIRLAFYLISFFVYLFFMLIERCIFKRILNDTNFRTWFHLIKNRYNRSLSSFTQLNVAFFGSDRFSSHILEHLYQLTTSGKKINRLEIVTSSSQKNMVQHCAIKHNINTHLWPNIDLLKGFDIGILASFGHLLPRKVIEAFPLGIVNIHPSLLPRWRGSSPLAYTIAAGDKIGGVSLMDIRPK
ncbi:unnamed protein product, partial [Didymodactylos carnosus]